MLKAIWLIFQQSGADDFVIAASEMHSVREFIEKAVVFFGDSIEWKGSGDSEIGI
jgi:GDPmannose 4,6-dehydratase